MAATDGLTSASESDIYFLELLEPAAEKLLADHIESSGKRRWRPDQYIPFSYATDYGTDYEWDPEKAPLTPELVNTLYINLLTEDNLPYYFKELDVMFGSTGVWGRWNRRWTAEEGRHADTIRYGLLGAKAIDPVMLECGRMEQVSDGVVPHPAKPRDGVVYVAIQELATRVTHNKTAERIDQEAAQQSDPELRDALFLVARGMRKVAADENRHYIFNAGLSEAAFRTNPTKTMISANRVVRTFEMPGTGIPEFDTRKEDVSDLGIYDGGVHFENIMAPILLKTWQVDKVDGLNAEGRAAQKDLLKFLNVLERAGKIDRAKRAEARKRLGVIST